MANLENNHDKGKEKIVSPQNKIDKKKKTSILSKVFKGIGIFLLLIPISLLVFVNSSFAKNWAAQKAIAFLNDEFKTEIQFKDIDLNIFGRITIHELSAKDLKKYDFLKVKEVYVDSNWFSLIKSTNELKFESLSLKELDLKVITYKGNSVSNFVHFINLFDSKKPKDPKKKPFRMEARINILDSKVSILNQNHDGDEGKWLEATDVNFKFPKILINGSHVSGRINQLTFKTKRWGKTHFLDTFSGDFVLNHQMLDIQHLILYTDKTLLQGGIRFTLNQGTWKDFGNKVKWNLDLKKGSHLNGYDVSYFVPRWDRYADLTMSGSMVGVLNQFELRDFSLAGKSLNLATQNIKIGKILDKSFLVSSSKLSAELTNDGLRKNLPTFISGKIGDKLEVLGRIKFNGGIETMPQKISVQKGNLLTTLGQAKINSFELKDYSTKTPIYKGDVDFYNMNLGALAKSNQIGTITGNVDIEGKGFDINTIELSTYSQIESIELMNKKITNLVLDGKLKGKIYDGTINIGDPKITSDLRGIIDFRTKRISADVVVSTRYLDIGYFTNQDKMIYKGDIEGKISMTNLSDITLDANLSRTELTSKGIKQTIPESKIKTYVENGLRKISLNVPGFVDGDINGQFDLKNMVGMFKKGVNKILAGNQRNQLYPHQSINWNLNISEGLMKSFLPELYFNQGALVTGNYNGTTNDISLDLNAPDLKYLIKSKNEDPDDKEPQKTDSLMVNHLHFKIDTKNHDDKIALNIRDLALKKYVLKNLNITAKELENRQLQVKVNFDGNMEGKQEPSDMQNYAVDFVQTTDSEGNYVFRFEPTELKLNHFKWKVDTSQELNHSIVYHKKTGAIDIHHFKLYSDESEILLDGTFKNKNEFHLTSRVNNFEVSKLFSLVKSQSSDLDIQGIANGSLEITKVNEMIRPIVDLKIEKLSMNGKEFGDVLLKAENSSKLGVYNVEGRLLSSNLLAVDHLKVTGNVDTNSKKNKLDLDVNFNDFDVSFAEQFVKNIFSNFRGKADGNVKINGNLDDISYGGEVSLKDFGLKLNFSGVDYSFDDATIPVGKGYVLLNSIGIKDGRENSKGSISGAIQFEDISKMAVQLIVNMDNLLLLNTTQKDFDTFWGTVYGKGDLFIDGQVTALNLSVNSKILNNSVFTINSNSATSVDEFKMLRFIHEDDKGKVSVSKKTTKGANMNIDFNVDVDKGSRVNLLLGENVGNIGVNGSATGLKFKMLRSGQMFMNGKYVVDNGTFVSKAVAERKFQIEKGSTMVWDGEVMNPVLNINANYFTTVNNAGEYLNMGEMQPINMKLTTEITQNLKNPKIGFNITAPDVSSQVKEALAFKMSNEDDRLIQFGSILALNSFVVSEKNSLGVDLDVTGAIKTQGYNLLFKQLGSVINTISNNVQVDFNYVSGNQYNNSGDRANAGVNISLSPRLTLKNSWGIPISRTQGTSSNILSGEVTLEYDWSQKNDGTRLFRIYSKPSNITSVVEKVGENQTWGVGLTYSKSFERLFKRKKNNEEVKNEKKDSVK